MALLMDKRENQSDFFLLAQKFNHQNNAFIQRDEVMLHGLENYWVQKEFSRYQISHLQSPCKITYSQCSAELRFIAWQG